MSNKVNFLRSSISGKAPTTAQLELGQIAINTADGKLFVRQGTGIAGDAILEVSADKLPLTGGSVSGELNVLTGGSIARPASLSGLWVRNGGTASGYSCFMATSGLGHAMDVRNNGDVRALGMFYSNGTAVSLSTHNHDSTYFKLTGGTVTGVTSFTGDSPSGTLQVSPASAWSAERVLAQFIDTDRTFKILGRTTQNSSAPFTFSTGNSFAFRCDLTDVLTVNDAGIDVAGTITQGGVGVALSTHNHDGTYAKLTGGLISPSVVPMATATKAYDGFVYSGADGVTEIGTYLDFHSSTNDGTDFRARINTNAAGDLVLKAASGNTYVGDITADRGDGTGVIFLAAGAGRYLYYDGVQYQLNGAGLSVGGTVTTGGDVRLGTTLWVNNDKAIYQHNGSHAYLRSQVGNLYLGAGGNTYTSIDTGGGLSHTGNITANGQLITGGTGGIVLVRSRSSNNDFGIYNTGNLTRFWWQGVGDVVTIDTAGNTTISGTLKAAGNITYTSDARMKSDIRALTEANAIFAGLHAKRYIKDDREQVGFIAQEVEEVLPEAVHTDDDGFKSLDLAPIVATLVEKVRELEERLAAMENGAETAQ